MTRLRNVLVLLLAASAFAALRPMLPCVPAALLHAQSGTGASAIDQDAKVKAGQIPDDVRRKMLDGYFEENSVLGILWSRYQGTSILLLVAIALSILMVRNYGRGQARQAQRTFDAMQTTAVMIFDKSLSMQLINRAAKQLLGLDEFVSLSEDHRYYFKSAPTPEILDTLEEMRRSRHALEREAVFSYNRVMRTLILKAYPLYSESKRLEGYLMLASDITEAIERDRRVNWSGVAQHVAHKAKTPLSTITLTAQHLEMLLTERSGRSVEGAVKYLDRIVGESRKLNDIVHNLTRLANKERLNLLPNDINNILANIADEYREKLTPNIQILTQFSHDLPRVGIDIAHFPEAVGNLMDNAIRAIGARDGRITLGTASGQWINRPGEYVEITIQDTGEGMSEEIKKSIFRPFSSHSHGGTGLGLVIVQKIVQEHNGEITFNSSPGLGTTFQIRLPVTRY
jgi:signal transduction histidine kinase